jgi:hypothetical protein
MRRGQIVTKQQNRTRKFCINVVKKAKDASSYPLMKAVMKTSVSRHKEVSISFLIINNVLIRILTDTSLVAADITGHALASHAVKDAQGEAKPKCKSRTAFLQYKRKVNDTVTVSTELPVYVFS